MDKLPDCEHQWPNEAKCQPAFRNSYHCPDCGTKWKDVWSCGCDDRCPNCDLSCSPIKSVEIAPCACRFLKPTSMKSLKEASNDHQ